MRATIRSIDMRGMRAIRSASDASTGAVEEQSAAMQLAADAGPGHFLNLP